MVQFLTVRAVIIVFAGFSLASCQQSTEAADAGATQVLLQDVGLRYAELSTDIQGRTERTRAILEERCGRCHRPDQEGATPEILAVFDLSDDIWWRNMTAERWSVMIDRLEGQNLEDAAQDVRTLADETIGGPVQF